MKLFHGDCLEKLRDIPLGSVDMVLADLPYGTTACRWDTIIPFAALWELLHSACKPSGALVFFGSEPFSSSLRVSNLKNFKYDWIWHKSHATGHLNAKKQPMREHEVISVFYRLQCAYSPILEDKPKELIRTPVRGGQPDCYGKSDPYASRTIPVDKGYPKSILRFNRPTDSEGDWHTTQKPVPLLEYLIKTYTNEGDTVLDPTMGSGSTGVACKNLNRKFIGIEMEQKYFEIAQKRIGSQCAKIVKDQS